MSLDGWWLAAAVCVLVDGWCVLFGVCGFVCRLVGCECCVLCVLELLRVVCCMWALVVDRCCLVLLISWFVCGVGRWCLLCVRSCVLCVIVWRVLNYAFCLRCVS